MTQEHSLYGRLDDPAGEAGHTDHPPRVGFFTDTSVCIGCKACEVACKEWNLLPDDGFDLLGMSYDNTGALGASTGRHVAFIEQEPQGARTPLELTTSGRAAAPAGAGPAAAPAAPATVDLGMPSFELPGAGTGAEGRQDFRWLMASDV